jgi:hypothetical protein
MNQKKTLREKTMLSFKQLMERVNETRSLYLEQDKKLIKAKDNGSYPAHHDHITHDTYGDAGEEATSAHHKFASERAPVHTFKHAGSTHKIYHHPNGSTIHTMEHTHGHHGDDIAVYSGHHDPKHIENQEKKHSNMNEEVEGLDEISQRLAVKAVSKRGADVYGDAIGRGDVADPRQEKKFTSGMRRVKKKFGHDAAHKVNRNVGDKIGYYEEVDLDESRMKDLATDMESLSHVEFKKKHKRTKQEMQDALKSEELKGNQHKIDANKNGKVDGHDFKILRNAKKARYQ